MAFVLEKDEEALEETPKSRFVLEKEEKPIKSSRQKETEAILSAIGPGADFAKGLVRGVGQFGGSVVDLISKLAPYMPGIQFSSREEQQKAAEELGKTFGRESITQKLASLGVQEPETVLGRTAQRLSSYGPFALGAGFVPSLISAGAGQLAEELGAGEGLQTAVELGAPFAKTIGRAVSKMPEAVKTFLKTKPGTYASGLEKPFVSEAPEILKKVSKVVPEQKEQSINFLGSQAETILEKIKNKLPQYSKYAEGFDFKGYHDEIFKDVQSIAKNFKGSIDTEPLLRFLNKQKIELQKIPNPTQGQKNSLKQIIQYLKSQRIKYTPSELAIAKRFGQKLPIYKGEDKLDTLLKVYRNLNVELGEILEKKLTSGKLPQYKKFLGDYKDEITKLFDSQLGPRNDFNVLFKTSNKSYADYQKIEELEKLLQPSTGEKLLPNDWTRLAKNKETPKLEKAVGKSMASEIQGLARDITDAQKNISKLKSAKTLTDLKEGPAVAVALATVAFPALRPLLAKGIGLEVGRRGIGYILLKPSRIQAYKNAVNALKNGDVKSYKNYLGPIIKAVGGEEKEED